MKRITLLLMLLAPAAHADTTTTNFGFIIPTAGSLGWGTKVDDWVIKIDTGVPGLALANTFTSSNTWLSPLLVSGSSITLTGNKGYVVAASSITTTGGLFGAALTVPSSGVSLTGGGTLAVPGGVSAASGTFTNGITASSGTFTATGAGQYSIVASSGIMAALFVGDGSQLTNLPAAGGGATLTGNNAFTGNNTYAGTESFSSTVTLSNLVWTSTANYGALVVNAEWSPIISTHIWGGVAGVTFTNILSTSPAGCLNHYPQYKMSVNILSAGSAGQWAIRYSTSAVGAMDATANNYTYEEVSQSNVAFTAQNACYVGRTGGTNLSPNPFQMEYIFLPYPGNDREMRGYDTSNGAASSNVATDAFFAGNSCAWPTTSSIGPIYGIEFFNTAGTFTGDITLYIKCGR